MAEIPEVRRRHWADVAAIVAGLALMGLAIWPVPFANTAEAGRQVSVWWIYALAGGLSLAGVFLGQRWQFRQLARACSSRRPGSCSTGSSPSSAAWAPPRCSPR